MPFNLASFVCVEFDVALSRKDDAHYQVPIAPDVKNVLKQMLEATLKELGDSSNWALFDCAEKYQTAEQLKLPVDDPILARLKNLCSSQNLPVAAAALNTPSQIDYYFARFQDDTGNMCIGFRRASQFKGTVGKSLMQWLDGNLRMVQGDIFRLDFDFDFLVFDDQVAIYKPKSFEHIAGLEDELAKATPDHIHALIVALPILDFSFAEDFANKSVRGRRLIAAIRSRTDLAKISTNLFKKACEENKISVVQIGGKWAPNPKHEKAFLELLDRRRYPDPLVEGDADLFVALARNKI